MTFASNLATGRVAEGLIAQWMMARGSAVLPVYELEKSEGKGPQFFWAGESAVAPDMLVFTADRGQLWCEAKHKSVFTWHRISGRWVTGIDIRHYEHYLRVSHRSGLPVWLMFFHRESKPWDTDISHGCPDSCPTGLFGREITQLAERVNHKSPPRTQMENGVPTGHGRTGMVYWAHDSLIPFATTDEVYASAENQRKGH